MRFLLSLKSVISLGILSGVMLWAGISKIGDAREKTPVIYQTVDNIDLKHAKWIRVNHGILDIPGSFYEMDYKPGSAIEEIFVPVLSENGSGELFFLQTKDHMIISRFKEFRAMSETVKSAETTLKLGQNDPQYVKFRKTTLQEMKARLVAAQVSFDRFMENYKPLQLTFSGILDPRFGLSNEEKAQLGYNAHIIEHNAVPKAGFWAWFLTIGGGILGLVTLLNLAELFLKVDDEL